MRPCYHRNEYCLIEGASDWKARLVCEQSSLVHWISFFKHNLIYDVFRILPWCLMLLLDEIRFVILKSTHIKKQMYKCQIHISVH